MNTQVKHTPGEYLIAPGDEKTFVYALNDQGYNRFYANVQGGHLTARECTSVAELEAVARLFSAAPKMIAALLRVRDWLDAPDDSALSDSDVADIRAAIARATGEQDAA